MTKTGKMYDKDFKLNKNARRRVIEPAKKIGE